MESEKPIDIKRGSGGSANIGTSEDGIVTKMFELDDKLLIIKSKSIYELVLADEVDPERENPDLPTNIQRRILNLGSESELVSRTLLMAQILFKDELLASINVKRALTLTFECLQELVVLENEVADYVTTEIELSQEYENRRDKEVSYAIPSISDVETRCKTIFQKVDHATQILMEIILLFYPNAVKHKQAHFVSFEEFLLKKYGKEDDFYVFLNNILPFLQMVRNTRNCLEHRLNDKFKVIDFEIQANGEIITPSFEIDSNGTKQPRVSLSVLLQGVFASIVNVAEELIAMLCSKHIKEGPMNYQVKFVPKERRLTNKHIQYSYWSPLGEGKYFKQ